MFSLPVEILLQIAAFLPADTIDELLGLNRVFFNLAMDARYGNIEFSAADSKSLKALSQLRSYPTIARRVHSLTVRFTQLVRGRESSPTPPFTSPFQKLKASLLHLNLRLSQKSTKALPVSFMELLQGLTVVFPTMINLIFFYVDACQNLPKEHDLSGFFSAAWSGFGRSIRSLSLGGNIEAFRVILGSHPALPAIRELRLEFTDGMNSLRLNSAEAPVAVIQKLLEDFVAPLMNGVGANLEVLRLESWASTDLSSFFKSLNHFPLLHTLSLQATFNRSFMDDSSGLTEVLYRASPTLKDLTLRLATTGSRLFNPDSDSILSQWLSAMVNNNEKFSAGLRSLDIYPPAFDRGLDSLIICVGRSAETLKHLNVRDRFLFVPEIAKILSAFHPYSNLTFLRLNVRELPVELLDLLAKSFPDLKTLELRAADGQPTPEFAQGLQTRSYPNWKLYDITIRQGANNLEYETMLQLAVCIPSVRSFWGQGNMMLRAGNRPGTVDI